MYYSNFDLGVYIVEFALMFEHFVSRQTLKESVAQGRATLLPIANCTEKKLVAVEFSPSAIAVIQQEKWGLEHGWHRYRIVPKRASSRPYSTWAEDEVEQNRKFVSFFPWCCCCCCLPIGGGGGGFKIWPQPECQTFCVGRSVGRSGDDDEVFPAAAAERKRYTAAIRVPKLKAGEKIMSCHEELLNPCRVGILWHFFRGVRHDGDKIKGLGSRRLSGYSLFPRGKPQNLGLDGPNASTKGLYSTKS